MAAFSYLDSMLQEIGMPLGQDLHLEPDGSLMMQTSSGVQCTLSLPPDDSEVRLAAPVADLAGHDHLALFEGVLRSDLLDEDAPLLRPGLLGDGGEIVVLSRLPTAGLTTDSLATALASFLRRATELRDRLRILAASAGPPVVPGQDANVGVSLGTTLKA